MPRKSNKLGSDKQSVVEILESLCHKWIEIGGTMSLINLDPVRQGLGLAIDGVFICVNCGHFALREDNPKNICGDCQKKLSESVVPEKTDDQHAHNVAQ